MLSNGGSFGTSSTSIKAPGESNRTSNLVQHLLAAGPESAFQRMGNQP